MKLNKQKIIVIALFVILLVLSEFFIFEKILQSKENELRSIAEKAYSIGVQDSINEIFKKMENCAIISVSSENITKNLIDIICIERYRTP